MKYFLYALFFLFVGVVNAQELVKDLNTCQQGSSIDFVRSNGTKAYFKAISNEYGEEVFYTDGANSGVKILADLNPGSVSSEIRALDLIGDSLYVSARGSNSSEEVIRVIDTKTGEYSALLTFESTWSFDKYKRFVKVGDKVFFIIRNASYQFELWNSDGSKSGTKKLGFLPDNSFPKDFIAYMGKPYFVLDGAEEHSLWSYNGSYTHRVFLADQGAYSYINDLTVFNDTLFFLSNNDQDRSSLWFSNGSMQNTDLYSNGQLPNGSIGNLTKHNERLYYTGSCNTLDQFCLYSFGKIRNDTEAINLSTIDSTIRNVSDIIVVGDMLLISTSDGATKQYWHFSDIVKSITLLDKTQHQSGQSLNLTPFKSGLLYNVNTDFIGNELWYNSLNSNTAIPVGDIYPGIGSSNPSSFIQLEEEVLFIAKTCETGEEFHIIQKTGSGSSLLTDTYQGGKSSYPNASIAFYNKLYFTASTEEFGNELYCTDGTSHGTVLVQDLVPGYKSHTISQFRVLNQELFFTRRDISGSGIYKVDSNNIVTKVVDVHSLNRLYVYEGFLYFDHFEPGVGTELFRSNGEPDHIELVRDINSSGGSHPRIHGVFNNELYFSANDGFTGVELWKTDGTESGTKLLKDINNSYNSVNSLSFQIGSFTPFGNILLFTADSPQYGRELWKTDGTESGTTLVKDIYPGIFGSGVRILGSFNGYVYLNAHSSEHGSELWRSDGTVEGTVLFKDINVGSASSYPFGFKRINDKFVFSAITTDHGNEIYVSNGTDSGTQLIKDINKGIHDSNPSDLYVYGELIFFSCVDSTGDRNLWVTDGSKEGTYLKFDFGGIGFSGDPSNYTSLGNDIYFSANDPHLGRELWKLEDQCSVPIKKDLLLDSINTDIAKAELSVLIAGTLSDQNNLSVLGGEEVILSHQTTVTQGAILSLDIKLCDE